MRSVPYMDSFPNLPNIIGFIEEVLSAEWVLCIEYASIVKPHHTDWEQWGSASFLTNDNSPVIEQIILCHMHYPDHSIRLNAQKFSPATKLIYPVYQAQYL